MDKSVYINEFLKQRQVCFGLSDLGTVSTWSGKGQYDKRDYDITHFKANFNNKTYRCYAIGGDENVMLELISDDDIVRELVSEIKISDEFEILNMYAIQNIKTLKLDLNNVKYITCDEYYIRGERHTFYLKANNLRLFNFVYYDDKMQNLRLKGFEYNLMNFLHFIECEIAELQYYTEKEIENYTINKRLKCLNTLKEGDIGYEELGIKSDGLVYGSSDLSLSLVGKYYREVNFIDEKQFLADCRFHNIEAINYKNADKYKIEEIKSRENKVLFCSYDELLANYICSEKSCSVVYKINKDTLKIYVLRDYFTLKICYILLYKQLGKVEKFTQSKTLLDFVEKEDEKAVVAARQKMIGLYERSLAMNLLCDEGLKCEIDGINVVYSYNAENNLLILHSMEIKGKSLTIPAVFDATLPFFSSDLEYLNLNNVQYIIWQNESFDYFGNLFILKGDRLRLSHLVNLKKRDMHSISLIETSKKTSKKTKKKIYANIVKGYDIFNYIHSYTKVYFPSLEFYTDAYNEKSFCDNYHYFNNIEVGSIGYDGAKFYEKYIRN